MNRFPEGFSVRRIASCARLASLFTNVSRGAALLSEHPHCAFF
jgi:hypothetical protein